MTELQNGLWWTADRRALIRTALAEGKPSAVFLEEQTRAEAVPGEDVERGGRGLEPKAVVAWLDGDRALAETVLLEWAAFAHHGLKSNLGEAGWALTGAAIADVVGDMVSTEVKRTAAEALWALTARLRVPAEGNPHVVTNNWWAVTHSGALCAALAAQRIADDTVNGYDAEAVDWALGRLKAFCHHFGPTGLYHEGLGYIRYTCIFLFSAVMAAKAQGYGDLLEMFPNLRMTLPSLYAATALRMYQDDSLDSGPAFGASLSWNDMGTGSGICVVDHIGLAIAPEEHQASLKEWFERLSGPKSPLPTLGRHHGCIPMAWAFHPLDHLPQDTISLPRDVIDSRQGLWIWRDRYQDENDVVFGLYAKTTHAGGHAHRDAGSLRLEAFGSDWIAGPGQARTRREGQTVAFPADESHHPKQLGAFNFQESRPDGLLAGMELRLVSGCYHERYVSLKTGPCSGSPLGLVMADLVDDHVERDWHWTWTYSAGLEGHVDDDGAGVRLIRADGMGVWIRFIEAKPREVDILELPESRRTFSGGWSETYKGKPYIRAVFSPRKHLAICIAALWGPADRLQPPAGNMHSVELGGTNRWDRPFGSAVPADFLAGLSKGPSRFSGAFKD